MKCRLVALTESQLSASSPTPWNCAAHNSFLVKKIGPEYQTVKIRRFKDWARKKVSERVSVFILNGINRGVDYNLEMQNALWWNSLLGLLRRLSLMATGKNWRKSRETDNTAIIIPLEIKSWLDICPQCTTAGTIEWFNALLGGLDSV